MGFVAEGHAREHAQVDQPGFLRAAHQLHINTELLLHRLHELAPVGGLPHGAGGGGEDLLHPVAGGELAAVAQGQESPLDRRRAEVARFRIALTQAGGGFLRLHHAERAQHRINGSDQQMDRVGADVDRRHVAQARGLLAQRGGLRKGPRAGRLSLSQSLSRGRR